MRPTNAELSTALRNAEQTIYALLNTPRRRQYDIRRDFSETVTAAECGKLAYRLTPPTDSK